MDVGHVTNSADYRAVQTLINSSTNIKDANLEVSAGKSTETVSGGPVVETMHLGKNINTYA